MLQELGEKVGGLDYTGALMAIKRVESKAKTDRMLSKAMKQLDVICEK